MSTENQNDWKPDYAITKGYPHDQPVSREKFVVRPILVLNPDNRIVVSADEKCYPDFEWPTEEKFDNTHNWLTNRLYDFQQALLTAEQQIDDMLKDYPFIPEDFGFKKIYGPKTISDPPTSVYMSIYDGNISIFRGQDDIWHLLKKRDTDGFDRMELKFPCHRIAYATFHALRIKVEDKQFTDTETMKTWTASYVPGDPTLAIHLEGYKAIDEDDAKSRASFMITTMIDENVIVDPKFLSVQELKPGEEKLKIKPDPKIVGYEASAE